MQRVKLLAAVAVVVVCTALVLHFGWQLNLSASSASASSSPSPYIDFDLGSSTDTGKSPDESIRRHVARLRPDLVSSASAADRRLIIVGDIHGCILELEKLLEKVGFDAARDQLLAVGDVLNKGPDSAAVVRLLRRHNAVAVRGNHEDSFLRKLHDDPLRTFGLSKDDLAWVKAMPLAVRLGRLPGLSTHAGEVIVVHAGLVPHVPLEEQNRADVMSMRTLSIVDSITKTDSNQQRYTASSDPEKGKPWFSLWSDAQQALGPAERTFVVYGHDARKGLQAHDYSLGLDTGCVKGHQLSAVVVTHDSHEIISVDSHRDYTL